MVRREAQLSSIPAMGSDLSRLLTPWPESSHPNRTKTTTSTLAPNYSSSSGDRLCQLVVVPTRSQRCFYRVI